VRHRRQWRTLYALMEMDVRKPHCVCVIYLFCMYLQLKRNREGGNGNFSILQQTTMANWVDQFATRDILRKIASKTTQGRRNLKANQQKKCVNLNFVLSSEAVIPSWLSHRDHLSTRDPVGSHMPCLMPTFSISTKQANTLPLGEILLGSNGPPPEHTNLCSVQCCLAFYGIPGIASFATSATYRPKKCAAK